MFATPDPSRSSPLARNLRLLQIEAGPHNARVFNRPVISRLVQGSPTSTPVIPYAVSGVTPARARFTVPLLFRQRRWRGSSPLARGLLAVGARSRVRIRIIPARAGFTRSTLLPGASRRDHPRSRGVYTPSFVPYVIPLGSSPLARGLLRSHSNFFGTRWIIPARAGFTKQVGVHLPNIGDHPRSRGVYVNAFGTADAIAGSSPLARGLRNTRPGKRKCSWIIPARAGFTRAGPASAGSPRDHPRSRGVYVKFRPKKNGM